MFRWGVLSTAKIGREQTLPAIAASTNGVLTAVASRDITRARALADQYSAEHAYGSYEELLASDTVDGVYIPLPTSHHLEWCLKAAAAGKHVLCEKPIAMQADDIDRLIAAERDYNVKIAEAFMVSYHPQWAKVRELIETGAIGQLRRVEGAFCYFNDDPANMRNKMELGGGALRDVGVYPTVTTRLATGMEPLRLRASMTRSPDFGTDVYTSVQADFGSFELLFYCSTQLALRQSMVFHGDQGWISLSAPFNPGGYDSAEVTLNSVNRSEQSIYRFTGRNQFKLQIEEFGCAAMGEEASVFTLRDSRNNQKVIDAAFQAAEKQAWVDL